MGFPGPGEPPGLSVSDRRAEAMTTNDDARYLKDVGQELSETGKKGKDTLAFNKENPSYPVVGDASAWALDMSIRPCFQL